jgi:hypothetical protein
MVFGISVLKNEVSKALLHTRTLQLALKCTVI